MGLCHTGRKGDLRAERVRGLGSGNIGTGELMGRRDCWGRSQMCTADVHAASLWGAGQEHGPFCICPTSPCCGSDREREGCGQAQRERGSVSKPTHEVRLCCRDRLGDSSLGVPLCPTPSAGEHNPRQNVWVGSGSPPSLCLGVSSASSPPQPDGWGREPVLSPMRRCFCWKGWHGCHGLMLVVMTTGGGCCVLSGTGEEGKEKGWRWRRS